MGSLLTFRSLKFYSLFALWALFCAAFLAGCASGFKTSLQADHSPQGNHLTSASTSPLNGKDNVKVALLLPLGTKQKRTANIAKSLKQAGELALFDFDNPNIVLITKDTKGTPEGAKAAAEAAVQSGAELIIGPLFAKSVKAAAPIAKQANVPMVAFSSDQSVAGNGVYLLSFLAGRDIPRIVNYAVAQGRLKFAALVPKTPYGQIVETAFRSAVNKAGGQVVIVEKYPLDANAMLEPVKKVAELAKDETNPIDTLLLPGGPETLPTLAPLMPYFEIDTKKIKLIGTGQWDYNTIGREKPLLKGWFPAPEPKGWRDFTQRYAKTYGQTPPRIASLSYDAVSLAVSLSANPRGQRFSPDHLARPSGFAGIDGLFRLRPDGTSERGLAVLEVQKFGAKVLESAPNTFGQQQISQY